MASTEVPEVLRGMAASPAHATARSTDHEPAGPRHYSGVLVVTRSDAFSDCANALNALQEVEVCLRHPDSARLVAVLEGDSVARQEEQLQAIRSIPGVMLASLVYHYVDANQEAGPGEVAAGGGRQHAE